MRKDILRTINETIIEPPRGWFNFRLDELWAYRELLFFFIWRDIAVRYKQTVLGAAWAVIQPVLTMVVFSVIFGKLANLPTDGIPYPIFSYTALLPWQLFARGLSDASSSLVSNQNLITKTYFPRLFLPASSVLSGLVDFGISFIVLLGMMLFYNVPLTWHIILLPLFIILALVTSMTAGMWLSAFNVRFRDVKYITPFLVQLWLFVTPIAYSSTVIPEKWRSLYGLNPMVGVVEGFRWAMISKTIALGNMFIVSVIVVVVLFIGGLIYFQRMDRTFADLV